VNHNLHKIAKEEGIKLRRTYVKEIKKYCLSLRFFRHPKKIKKAKASMRRLRTIASILMRDISRKLTSEQLAKHKEIFELYQTVPE